MPCLRIGLVAGSSNLIANRGMWFRRWTERCSPAYRSLHPMMCMPPSRTHNWHSRVGRNKLSNSGAQVAYRYRELLIENTGELSRLIHEEHGKTLEEAKAEIVRAIEVTEFACSLPQLAAGEVLEVSPGVECRVDRMPLGVVASIVPFNFPMMVPHWTMPIAITLGNVMVFKPSEKVPLTTNRVAELLQEAGLPPGVFNVVHGERAVVEAICDHPLIQAVTFVGSTKVAKSVYARATGHLKRRCVWAERKTISSCCPMRRQTQPP